MSKPFMLWINTWKDTKKTSSDILEELFVQTEVKAGKKCIGANGSGFKFYIPNNQEITFC